MLSYLIQFNLISSNISTYIIAASNSSTGAPFNAPARPRVTLPEGLAHGLLRRRTGSRQQGTAKGTLAVKLANVFAKFRGRARNSFGILCDSKKTDAFPLGTHIPLTVVAGVFKRCVKLRCSTKNHNKYLVAP